MSAGFYKLDLQGQRLIYAENSVVGPNFTLDKNNPPAEAVNGWKWFDSDVDAYTYHNMIPESQPWAITPLQAKLALNRAGILEQVETYLASADKETQIAWESASEFRRDSPLLLTISIQLGMTDKELDDLFLMAKEIEV